VDSQQQQTAADVAAAAGAVAATAAFQVIQAAGKEVQAQLQVLNSPLRPTCPAPHSMQQSNSFGVNASSDYCERMGLHIANSDICHLLEVICMELAMHFEPCRPAWMLLLCHVVIKPS